MKEGDYVILIDEQNKFPSNLNKNSILRKELSFNKQYKILDCYDQFVTIRNDKGLIEDYFNSRFVCVREQRLEKLKQLTTNEI